MSTVRHLSVLCTHLSPSELLLLAHCGLLEHLFSTLHQPHSRPPSVMQVLQSVKLEHSSTGRRCTWVGKGQNRVKSRSAACETNGCQYAIVRLNLFTYFIFSECIHIVRSNSVRQSIHFLRGQGPSALWGWVGGIV